MICQRVKVDVYSGRRENHEPSHRTLRVDLLHVPRSARLFFQYIHLYRGLQKSFPPFTSSCQAEQGAALT